MRHKRLLAMAAAILLLLLYASTIVFALMDSPLSQSLLMASSSARSWFRPFCMDTMS